MASQVLNRKLGLAGLMATGICSMIGASINVVPFMIQRNVPGIGPYVLPAFLFAALPALLAAAAYGLLSTAMPRAGGSYVYVSRGFSPYLGFIASFSQWFGLSIVIGVVAYIIVPFLRDVARAAGWEGLAEGLEIGAVRLGLSLFLLWLFVWVNIRGASLYEKTVVPLMVLMFLLGGIVIVSGYSFGHDDFAQALLQREGRTLDLSTDVPFDFKTFLSAAALLFASFIGFDSIAQAGGEARNPTRNLPLATGLTIGIVGAYYMLFTGAVYHAVPYQFVAQEAQAGDISAPGLLGYLLPSGLTVAIVAGAAVALTNDLPAMLLSVSRLMFAWSEDGIFPKPMAKVHPKHHTPHIALLASGAMATIGILGSHLAGDYFLGIDIMVTSMMVNFLLVCATLVAIEWKNPVLAGEIQIVRTKTARRWIGGAGVVVMLFFLSIHTYKDLSAPAKAWYFHSTPVWLIVMGVGSLVFYNKYRGMKRAGIDSREIFQSLP
ncbi:MAG: hypothetical protein RL181_2454 [Bacteroidota bacterium]